MNRGWLGVFALALVMHAPQLEAQRLWQADVLIRSLEVTELNGNLLARIVVLSAGEDEARAARVEVLMPVGVGIVRMGVGCSASAAPAGVSALRASVTCELGTVAALGSREVFVLTTIPPQGVLKTFGVFAMSDTPDPKPGNNYAEKTLP